MGDVATEVPSYDAMPRGVVLFVEFFLDESCNVLFNVVFFQGLRCAIYSILLHVLRHVSILDDGFSVGHFGWQLGSGRILYMPLNLGMPSMKSPTADIIVKQLRAIPKLILASPWLQACNNIDL